MKGQLLADLPTPFFVVNRQKVASNCRRMLEYCKAHAITLRPHVKTSKCVEVALMMTEGIENRPITVSTVAEAEFFAKNGFKDILFANFAVDRPRIERLHALMVPPLNVSIHVFVDGPAGLAILEKSPPPTDSKKWSVYLMVDCGHENGGAVHNEVSTIELAHKIDSGPATTLHGLYTHEGHSYSAKSAKDAGLIGVTSATLIVELANKLKMDKKLVIGIGSTPSCFSHATGNYDLPSEINEFHPGNYAFCDMQQLSMGICELDNIACAVGTRVIGHYPTKGKGQMLVDAGFTALSHDLGRVDADCKDGTTTPRLSLRIVGHPELVFTNVKQEIGNVRALNASESLDLSKYPVGSVLYVQPYHSCTMADKFPGCYVTDDDVTVADKWTRAMGW